MSLVRCHGPGGRSPGSPCPTYVMYHVNGKRMDVICHVIANGKVAGNPDCIGWLPGASGDRDLRRPISACSRLAWAGRRDLRSRAGGAADAVPGVFPGGGERGGTGPRQPFDGRQASAPRRPRSAPSGHHGPLGAIRIFMVLASRSRSKAAGAPSMLAISEVRSATWSAPSASRAITSANSSA